jgi:hypothetical protein
MDRTTKGLLALVAFGFLATTAVTASFAAYKRVVKLPQDYLGHFEAFGEDNDRRVFDGSRCHETTGAGGNPLDKIEISASQIRYIRDTVRKNHPSLRDPVCLISRVLEEEEDPDTSHKVDLNCRGSSTERWKEQQVWHLQTANDVTLLLMVNPKSYGVSVYFKCRGR